MIDRVVDSADLKRPDDSLKEQMSGLQIFSENIIHNALLDV